MDFNWTKEQIGLRNRAVKFAQEKLNNNVIKQDSLSEFPRKKWLDCAEFGVHGLIIPEQYGGLGLDILTAMLIIEGLGYGCKDNGLLLSINVNIWNCAIPILHFGTDAQKQKCLPGLCNGSMIGAYGMTEPESGSDAFSLRTTAVQDGNGYVLNGTKTLITNAPVADMVLVFAKVPGENGKDRISCFIVGKGTTGLSLGKKIDKMGLRTSPFGEVVMQDCVIGKNDILGKEGQGQAIFNDALAEDGHLYWQARSVPWSGSLKNASDTLKHAGSSIKKSLTFSRCQTCWRT